MSQSEPAEIVKLRAALDAHTAPTGWPSPQTTAKVVVAAREVLAAYEAGRLT